MFLYFGKGKIINIEERSVSKFSHLKFQKKTSKTEVSSFANSGRPELRKIMKVRNQFHKLCCSWSTGSNTWQSRVTITAWSDAQLMKMWIPLTTLNFALRTSLKLDVQLKKYSEILKRVKCILNYFKDISFPWKNFSEF